MSSMAGIRHSFGAKVRDAVKEAEAFTLTFFDQFFQHPIGQALREAQKKTEDTLEQWFQDQVSDGDQSPVTSSPPSYRTRSTSDPECPGPEWERTPVWFESDGSEFLIPDEQGRLTHAQYVNLLRPTKAKTPASPYDAVKRRLFDQEEPFLNWVEEALEVEDDRSLTAGVYNYRYQCRQIAATERLMNQVAKNLGMYVDHKMEALRDLKQPMPSTASSTTSRGPTTSTSPPESKAFEAYRQVTRILSRTQTGKSCLSPLFPPTLPSPLLTLHPYAPQPLANPAGSAAIAATSGAIFAPSAR
ncbi:hypothetical protein BJV77DRAFT_968446 [Russula vinacea]|nr:hypothetical protein BJV77DRAFT_968446 [Russula vinacea]